MPDQIQITESSGQRRMVPARGAEIVFGSAVDADIRVAASGIEARHLKFVRTSKGVRVETVRPGGTVAVNGETLFCRDLQRDDVIRVGAVELRWMPGDEPAPPPRSKRGSAPGGSAPRGSAPGGSAPARSRSAAGRRGGHADEGERASSRRPRRSGVPHAALVGGALLTALVVILVVVRVFGDAPLLGSPQAYVDLARQQVANQQPQRALDTLSVALRDATGETRIEAQRLDAEIRRMLVDTASASKVLVANQEHDLLQNYADTYLRDKSERAAARDLVRQCDEWLARHRDACARNTDGKTLLANVEALRGKFLAAAALGEPDTAADAIFAARSRLRFQWRDYRGAIARLDAFLAANPGSEEARTERAKMFADGQEWVTKKLRSVDSLLSRGDTSNAEKDLANLEKWSVLPEWSAMLSERRQRLSAPK